MLSVSVLSVRLSIPETNEHAGIGIHKGDTLYRGRGCNYCSGTGYYGRIAIHEIMAVTREIKSLINDGGTTSQLRAKLRKMVCETWPEEAIDIAKQGTTTIEEAMKIAFRLEGKFRMNLDELIKQAIEAGASDIHFTVGAEPSMRLHGEVNTTQQYNF